jgi:hypothetical protein
MSSLLPEIRKDKESSMSKEMLTQIILDVLDNELNELSVARD